MKIKYLITFLLIFVTLIATQSVVCNAATPSYAPYYSYEINNKDQSVAAPIGFVQSGVANSTTLKLKEHLDGPEDFVIYGDEFYILDSSNSRIIVLDKKLKFKQIYSGFTDTDNKSIDFSGAMGMDIDKNGNFVIADTENLRVIILGRDKKLKKQILKPESVLENNDFPFRVTKLKCAQDGNIYVTVETMNVGIFVFNGDGKFDKFVANNPVVATSEVILNYIYRAFLTTEQIRNRMQATPLKVNNFCLDSNGFLYTVSQSIYSTKQSGMVRCMNYKDNNIINSSVVFGDVEADPAYKTTLFNSISITENNDYVLLDSGRGKVFYYDSKGNLISVFGGYGSQSGTFTEPVEVRYADKKIYVLDKGKGSIVEFKPTEYVNIYNKALSLLKERKFEESMKEWKKVVLLNSNSRYAYYGMGLVYDMQGNYKEAMRCFKLADNRASYSNSFKEYRSEWMEKNVLLIILIVLLIIAAVVLLLKAFKKLQATNGTAYTVMERKSLFPLYTLRHPVDGFEQFKQRDVASTPIAIGILLVWLISEVVSRYALGFAYSDVSGDFNPLAIIAGTIGLFAVFVAANWGVASFIEGKGTFKDITVTVAYSLIPYVAAQIIRIPLTHFLTLEESVFIGIISTIGLIWSGIILLGGLYAIHQYSFSKTLVSLLLTAIGMLIILLVAVIFASLIQQASGFFSSLYQEITL